MLKSCTCQCRHAPQCLQCMEQVKDHQNFRFCAFSQVVPAGTVALCYNHPRGFTGDMPAGVINEQKSLQHKHVLLAHEADLDLSGTAAYSNNSLVLLSRDDSTFSRMVSEGNCVIHLSLCAIKRCKCRFAEVIKHCKVHMQSALHIPDLQVSSFALGCKKASVTWSTSVTQAERAGMLQFAVDGSGSEDKAARVVLHIVQNWVAVCFPLLWQRHASVLLAQKFAISETPHSLL